jgi:hypothetical protein
VARKKTVLGGVTIGPDIELLLLIAGGGLALYWLWNKYGASAVSSISSDISSATSDLTGSVDSAVSGSGG